MCWDHGRVDPLCRIAPALGPSEADVAEEACLKAGQPGRPRVAHSARAGPGGGPADGLLCGRRARVQYYRGLSQRRPVPSWEPYGMPKDPDLSAPAVSPTHQARAEAGRSAVAVPRKGCLRAHEACRGWSASQGAEPEIQRLGFDQAGTAGSHRMRWDRFEGQGAEPEIHHAVPSPRLGSCEAETKGGQPVRWGHFEIREEEQALHQAVPSSRLGVHQAEMKRIRRARWRHSEGQRGEAEESTFRHAVPSP